MIRNTKLKKCLQLLAQSTLPVYKKHLLLDKRLSNDKLHIYITLGKLDQNVTENPEFSTCTSLMENDNNIKALQGNLVGTHVTATIVKDEKSCILSFLQQLYIKNPEYEQDLFDQEYSSFEDLFYSNTLRFRDSARLYNFQYGADEIGLGSGIVIRKTTSPGVPSEDYAERMYKPYDAISKSDFVIEREYDLRKIIGRSAKSGENKIKEELPHIPYLFDLVITSLRILKPSAVYRDHRISSELLTFHPSSYTITTMPFFGNTAIGEKCEIETEDVSELKAIFTFLINEKESRFIIAQRRLYLGIVRNEPEDRLIDYMIGLEALYLPNGSQELSFRLSLRVALLLCSELTKRKETYNFVKEMYDTRSNIVHGTKHKHDLNVDEISKLEELLRRSLKLWIYDKSNFAPNKYSKSGILQSEGKLDNLFFVS